MLIYHVHLERLTGTVGPTRFDIRAWSGGGRGSRVHPSGDPRNRDPDEGWDYHTKTDDGKGVRGGYIPPGMYIVRKPERRPSFRKVVAVLEPTLTVLLDKRPPTRDTPACVPRDFWIRPFLIHPQGPRGSDGCIVVGDRDYAVLMEALTANGPVTLLVRDEPVGGFSLPRDARLA